MSGSASKVVTFGQRLEAAFERYGHLCVGIDPHAHLLEHWELDDSARGVREFGLRVVDAAAERVGIIKPQVAFFERFGAAGYAALEDIIRLARDSGLLVIADVKRGDVGTSVAAYAEAWLKPGSPLESDAMTVSAFQGFGSLAAPAQLAETYGKGLFVLAATSNPESRAGQRAVIRDGESAGDSVAKAVLADVTAWNQERISGELGSVGVVLGATVDLTDYGIDISEVVQAGIPPVLAPGFGYQGAGIDDLRLLFGAYTPSTIVAQSRNILQVGPAQIKEAVIRGQAEVQNAFG